MNYFKILFARYGFCVPLTVIVLCVPYVGQAQIGELDDETVHELEAFIVEGAREARFAAAQMKRTAQNQIEVISIDAAGRLPDENVADALARVTGLSITHSRGEGQFVSIRGVEPGLNNVTVDGATMAPPAVAGRTGRAVPLDTISASQIAQIEVIKSVTPDMDGHSLGGTINITGVSGFDRDNRFIYGGAEVGENLMINGKLQKYNLTYGDVFDLGGGQRLAIALSGSYSDRPWVGDDMEIDGWDDDDGREFPDGFNANRERGDRKRTNLNLNLQYRPADQTEFYFRALYSLLEEVRNVDMFEYEVRSDPVFLSDRMFGFPQMRPNLGFREVHSDQTIMNYTAGTQWQTGNVTIVADVTYSYAEEDVHRDNTVQFRSAVQVPDLFEIDLTRFMPTFDDKGVSQREVDGIALRRFRLEGSHVEEKTWTPRLDITWDSENVLGTGREGYLKAGVKYTDRKRFVDDDSDRFVNSNLTVSHFNARGPGHHVFDNRYYAPISILLNPALETFAGPNAARMSTEELIAAAHAYGPLQFDQSASFSNSVEDDFDIREKILAGYVMASIDVNPRLNLLGGLRVERTDADLHANEFREVDGQPAEVIPRFGSHEYTHYLPNFQGLYRLTEQSQLRFAYTRTIGRPAYEDASPITATEFELVTNPVDPDFPWMGEMEAGNPSLVPFESDNLDFAYEHYFRFGGAFTAGVFYKKIANPIYEFEEVRRNVVIDGFALETLEFSETRNADDGEILGLELSLQLPFFYFTQNDFLRALQLDLNATFIDSEVTVFGREDESLSFFLQPSEIYNVALHYQAHGLTVRLAYNHQSDRLVGIGSNSTRDRYNKNRHYYDLQASYRFNENYEIYFNWENITNEIDAQFLGDTSRVARAWIYGSIIRAGMRFSF